MAHGEKGQQVGAAGTAAAPSPPSTRRTSSHCSPSDSPSTVAPPSPCRLCVDVVRLSRPPQQRCPPLLASATTPIGTKHCHAAADADATVHGQAVGTGFTNKAIPDARGGSGNDSLQDFTDHTDGEYPSVF
uniref:Uncharacterized protein n=1 Tax=Oryza meridionalis TaxID=40149 RepID=A0A0E0E2L2_9ORYZ